MRTFYSFTPSGRGAVVFCFDIDEWVFPLCFRYESVGNDHRPWIVRIEFLCFSLVFPVDKNARI